MISALSTFKPILYIDMDNVLVDFQSGINKLSEYEKKEYEGQGRRIIFFTIFSFVISLLYY